jgi:hypothetical protein
MQACTQASKGLMLGGDQGWAVRIKLSTNGHVIPGTQTKGIQTAAMAAPCQMGHGAHTDIRLSTNPPTKQAIESKPLRSKASAKQEMPTLMAAASDDYIKWLSKLAHKTDPV